MPDELKGKLVLVTGGGSGIGRACCILFAQENATVIVADVKQTEETLNLLTGCGHSAFVCDVSSKADVDQLLSKVNNNPFNNFTLQIRTVYSTVPNCVVHCAGILMNLGGIEECDEDTFDILMKVNVKGTYLINRQFALAMRDNDIKGSIVNISSIAVNGSSMAPAYAATKAAQDGWTFSIAKELGKYGIRCNTVRPGSIDTPFVNGVRAQIADPNIRPSAPLGRLGDGADVAQVCLFLCSDRASYVTCSGYDVHGGAQVNG